MIKTQTLNNHLIFNKRGGQENVIQITVRFR